MPEYFFDTYAAIELIKKNPNYLKYVDAQIRITFLNLLEIAYIMHIEHGYELAKQAFLRFKEFVVDIPDEVILETVRFRSANKKKSLSYADCIGYIYAKNHGMIFLTGDDAFEHMENVEFVK